MKKTRKQTMLRDYIATFTKDFNLRYSYLRDKQGTKIGVAVSFIQDGKIMVGVSKPHRKTVEFEMCNKKHTTQVGDEFEINYGIARAIEQAVPLDHFVAKYTLKQLPKLPIGRRSLRDTKGKTVTKLNERGKKVVVMEDYDQYQAFIDRTRRRETALLENFNGELEVRSFPLLEV